MSFQREIVEGAAAGVGIAARAEDLSTIHSPGCAAAIWRRQLAPELQSFLGELDPAHWPQARVILRPQDMHRALTGLCSNAGTPEAKECAMLIDDIATLSGLFAELMSARYLRLRLERVTTNACRKFHIDAVTARLICTYRGTGTQYGISTDGADPARVFTVPAGMPMILRGTLWPGDPPSGLLHRSPPIEGTNEVRFVLVLDPVIDPEFEI
ncbi:DUF1826 domain-containing protein [Roseovarius sp. CAU 1744]|uniref:DUF1826 domain-containing protein n=1 Tax=Roseovarius sp. CAU 1744 TaxID=3140368 RepID=UPI00325B47C3